MAGNKSAKTCADCSRDVRQLHRGRCGRCYARWRKFNAPPNAACAVCGVAYFRRSSASPQGQTCSTACFAKWKCGRDQHNQPTRGAEAVTQTCAWCARPFEAVRRHVTRGGGVYCSIACSSARRAVPRGQLTCQNCGGAFEKIVGRLFFVGARYCSRACHQEWQSAHRVEKEAARSRAYRRFAQAEIRRRGGRCSVCESREDLALHHLTRTRERPDLLFDRDNLAVLCRSCHTKTHNHEGHTNPAWGDATHE